MRSKLTTKLTWGFVGLTSGVIILTTIVLGYGVYVLTERGFKAMLSEGASEVIVDYLEIIDGVVYQRERVDGLTLGVMLRNRDLSATLVDTNGQILARYGIAKDLSDKLPSVEPVGEGKYKDIKIDGYGIFDTYTVPIKSGDMVYGYMQLLRKNTELLVLRQAVIGGAIVVLPISWVVAAGIAWSMGRRMTAPLNLLVEYLERIGPAEGEHEIQDSPQMDHEVWVVSQELNRLIARLRESMQRQQQITENISHEFKTPLTRIASSLEVGKITEAKNEVLELGGNVDALLSLALGAKTAGRVNWIPVIHAQLKLVPVGVRVIKRLPQRMLTPLPYSHAQIVWRNLIGNAIKHNKKGGYIKIIGRVAEDGWSVTIINSSGNVGIDTAKLLKRKYKYGAGAGAGIGMSIVAEMCKLYKLRLDVGQLRGEMRVSLSG